MSFYHIDSQDLMYAFRDDDGTWSVDLAAFNGRVGTWSSIAIDPAGVPHISAYRASDRNVVLVTPAPGDTWNAEAIDSFGDVGESNSIGIDAYGGIHVVYRDRDNGRPLHAWWMDWNVNGMHDATDIANGLLTDCDGNEIPDDDCNFDGVLDACQVDQVATIPGTPSNFFEPSSRAGEFVAGGDLNGDGHVDLVFSERERVLVHLGGPDFDGVAASRSTHARTRCSSATSTETGHATS